MWWCFVFHLIGPKSPDFHSRRNTSRKVGRRVSVVMIVAVFSTWLRQPVTAALSVRQLKHRVMKTRSSLVHLGITVSVHMTWVCPCSVFHFQNPEERIYWRGNRNPLLGVQEELWDITEGSDRCCEGSSMRPPNLGLGVFSNGDSCKCWQGMEINTCSAKHNYPLSFIRSRSCTLE